MLLTPYVVEAAGLSGLALEASKLQVGSAEQSTRLDVYEALKSFFLRGQMITASGRSQQQCEQYLILCSLVSAAQEWKQGL